MPKWPNAVSPTPTLLAVWAAKPLTEYGGLPVAVGESCRHSAKLPGQGTVVLVILLLSSDLERET